MQMDAEIEGSRRGDRDAFARIIERYQRAVYAVAFSGVRDRALADDVAQEAFVIAWRRLDDLRDPARLPAWLCGIARNCARDARKRLRREAPLEEEAMHHPTTPFDELSEAESEQIVAAALARVPDVYREPLVLYYYEERSIDDVARALGISPATTNKRLSRGRQYLAESVAVVERNLLRVGPSATLAAAVLAAISVPSHVEAATVKGTSNMYKLALAAIVTASLGGTGYLLVDSQRGDAHPATSPTVPPPSPSPLPAADHGSPEPFAQRQSLFAMMHGAPHPTLPAATASAAPANDCATVGRHLAELDSDTDHGPTDRPTCTDCAARYASHCESQQWSTERRNCMLAAADLINAHLCARSSAPPPEAKPAAIPAHLACTAIAPKLAAIAQGAGMHQRATDLDAQIAAACEDGNWSLELRTCMATGTTIEALETCVIPSR